MMSSERPSWTRSRLWFLVPCVIVIPIFLGITIAEVPSALTTLAIVSMATALAAALLVVWLVVRTHRSRKEYEQRFEAWATERGAQQERLTIARELHDLTSHGISLITIRAASTADLPGPEGEAERQAAMGEIEQIGRETMAELRRMLTVLRQPGTEPEPRKPADSLESLPSVIRAAEDAGLDIDVDTTLTTTPPPSVQLTIIALVRETLANTMRYAGPTTVQVSLAEVDDRWNITVHDDGPRSEWTAYPGSGHGLTGVSERLALHEGTLELRPENPGFTVRAEIPIGES